MELQNGRPADAAGRMEKEIRTYNFLDELGVDYQRVDHEAAFTMEACKEVDEALGVEMCTKIIHNHSLALLTDVAMVIHAIKQILRTNIGSHNKNRVLKVYRTSL